MKIALISNHVTTHVTELAAALVDDGHQVSLLPLRDTGEPVQDDAALTCLGQFAKHLDASWAVDPPDVAHAHGWMVGIATQLVARRLGVPVVQTFEGLRTAPTEHAQLEATAAKSADWVTATCTDEIFELMRLGRSRNRTSVVPCGVDTGVFTPDGSRPTKGAEYRIVAFSGPSHNGLDALVRAMPKIAKTELIVVGGNTRVQSLASELGVARRVHTYPSAVSAEFPELLRSADIVVSSEPSGSGALEAMACAKPVVAPAVGALPDIVVADVTGDLVPPNDPHKMAKAINVLLRDAFRRQSFGAAGRDRACARYSWKRVAEDMVGIYERLASSTDPNATTSG